MLGVLGEDFIALLLVTSSKCAINERICGVDGILQIFFKFKFLVATYVCMLIAYFTKCYYNNLA